MLIDFTLNKYCARKPKPKMRGLLQAACAELLSSDAEKRAKTVHNWVEFSKKEFSKSESGFVNAVLRKCSDFFENPKFEGLSANKVLAVKYGHPQWLVERWQKMFSEEKTLEILKLAQIHSEVFFRKVKTPQADAIFAKYSQFFTASKNSDFYILKSGSWDNIGELLNSPYFYIQDPSTLRAPRLLNPEPYKKYLDLCAAPGGKSRAIADLITEHFFA